MEYSNFKFSLSIDKKIKLLPTFVSDMDIVESIFLKINNTVTQYGNAVLKHQLGFMENAMLQPILDAQYYISNKSNYREKLLKKLNKFAKYEKSIKSWMNDWCDNTMCFSYGKKDSFMNNPIALAFHNKIKFSTILITVIFYIVMYFIMKHVGMEISPLKYAKSMVTGTYTTASLILSFLIPSNEIAKYVAMAFAFGYGAFQLYNIYQTIMNCVNHYKKCDVFIDEYHNVKNAICLAKDIYDMDLLKQTYLQQDDITNLNIAFKKLNKIFNDNESLGSTIVHKLHKDVYLKYVNVIMSYIGTLDVMISNVKSLDNGFSIPEIFKGKTPYVIAKQIWHPMLDQTTAVKNNFELGKPTTMVITGPNKAGKSTYMRALIYLVYLAQSLGITCAESLSFTPFDTIYTYLNVPDSVGKESLFEAELERCYGYYKHCIKNTDGKLCIGFMDELFTGTNNKEGISGSYAIIKKISESANTLTVLTTHFHDICSLENIVYRKFTANEKIDVDGNKHYTFPYSIRTGISDQCIALGLLQERGFGKEILDIALEKMNQLNKKDKLSKVSSKKSVKN